MDTKSKKFNLGAIKKAIAVIICLLCVAGCAGRVLTGLIAYDNSGLSERAFDDAFLYGGKKLGTSEIVMTKTFKNHIQRYTDNLSYMTGHFGDGSEKAYKEWKKTLEENNEILLKNARLNLINHVVQDSFFTYLSLVSDNTVEPLGYIQAAEYSGSSYDYYEDDINYSSVDYGELCFNGTTAYAKETLPEEVREKADELGADGVFEINNYYKIVNYDNEDVHSEVTETYQPGYYAFRIDDAELEDRLVKGDYLQKDWYGSTDEFNKSYNFYAEDNREKYPSGRYFIKDDSGTVYTNVDGLGSKSTKEEIEKAFSKLGFYCIGSGYGNLRLPDGTHYCYGGFDADRTTYEEVFYDYAYVTEPEISVHTTTLPAVTAHETTTTTNASSVEKTTLVQVEVTDRNGDVKATSLSVTVPEAATTRHSYINDSTLFVKEDSENFLCYVGVDMFGESYAQTDLFRTTAEQIETAKGLIIDYMLTLGIMGALFLVCFIYLIVRSGRRKGSDEVHLFATDKIFVDWRIFIDCFLGWLTFLLFVLLMDNLDGEESIVWFQPAVTVVSTLFAAIVLDLVLFIVRHIKAKSLFTMLSPVWFIKKAWSLYKDRIKPVVSEKLLYTRKFAKGTLIRIGIVVAANLLLGSCTAFEMHENYTCFLCLPWILFDVIVLVWVIRFVGGINKIFTALEEIRCGNYNVHINLYALPSTLRESASKVMNLRDGLKTAVEEAVKQEQTKTELITNVSHDLKTPLTSIINYVELLKNCDISDPDAKEYLDVLGEKSDRLKKLIEDLVEASKASTGNIKVDMVRVSLNEMVSQLLGEHADDLEKRKLNVIAELPQENVTVNADGKLIYRVMENLIVNVQKYSLYGTRVYVTVKDEGACGTVTFKNISEQPLNITADQLKERFVRGDESRSTEGNGLGLSIAQSLCDVQGGQLEISISGDLFTAKVKLKK